MDVPHVTIPSHPVLTVPWKGLLLEMSCRTGWCKQFFCWSLFSSVTHGCERGFVCGGHGARGTAPCSVGAPGAIWLALAFQLSTGNKKARAVLSSLEYWPEGRGRPGPELLILWKQTKPW